MNTIKKLVLMIALSGVFVQKASAVQFDTAKTLLTLGGVAIGVSGGIEAYQNYKIRTDATYAKADENYATKAHDSQAPDRSKFKKIAYKFSELSFLTKGAAVPAGLAIAASLYKHSTATQVLGALTGACLSLGSVAKIIETERRIEGYFSTEPSKDKTFDNYTTHQQLKFLLLGVGSALFTVGALKYLRS